MWSSARMPVSSCVSALPHGAVASTFADLLMTHSLRWLVISYELHSVVPCCAGCRPDYLVVMQCWWTPALVLGAAGQFDFASQWQCVRSKCSAFIVARCMSSWL